MALNWNSLRLRDKEKSAMLSRIYAFMFQNLNWTTDRALGLSDFNAMGLILQEIIHTFDFKSKMGSWDIYTQVAHKMHTMKKYDFYAVVCS